jgi:hypothetical protein
MQVCLQKWTFLNYSSAIIFARKYKSKLKRFISLVIAILFTATLLAQDTLPGFTIVERGDKVIVSWTNPYEKLVQLNVQRSFDSSKYFSTVYSATSPQLPQNGFTDTKLTTTRIYYRIFYVLEGGNYFFSKSKRVGAAADNSLSRDINNASLANVSANDNRTVTIKIRDAYRQIPAYSFRAFRDSILRLTKDSLIAVNDSLVLLNPYVSREAWRASSFVFVNREGYINVSLPFVNDRKYRIRFFEESGAPIFEIKHLQESPLILDKANFVHSGWFLFELYEDDKLKERNKFYLPKDF